MPKHYIFTCDNPECGLEVYRYRNLKICPKCQSPVTREEPMDFRAACWICGTRQDLEMIAHRNEHQQMVGWLFVCIGCVPQVADRDLVVNFSDDSIAVQSGDTADIWGYDGEHWD